MSKTAITIRVEAGLLAAARRQAAVENCTLINYIESILEHSLGQHGHIEAITKLTTTIEPDAASQPMLLPFRIHRFEEALDKAKHA